MATFNHWGLTSSPSATTSGPFNVQTNSPILIADRVYRPGDEIDITSTRYAFRGYEESAGHLVFELVTSSGIRQFLILFNGNSGRANGQSYTASGAIVTDDPVGVGEATFTNHAIRSGSEIGDGAFVIQGTGFSFPHDVYEAGDPVMLDFLGGGPRATTFVGYESDTGNPIFRSTSGSGATTLYVGVNENTLFFQDPYTVDNVVTTGEYVTCFAPGTLIATPAGERAVETLKPGDKVLTADGHTVPVRFVGFQKVPTMFGPREFTHPVRILAGALGRNVPHTDLVVTKDHGMIVDGVICHAGALVNGTSIVEVPTRELARVATYYHVETEGHVPLLANGAVAESFIDEVDRARFANHGEFVAMYGARVPAMTQMNLPRAMSMRQVPRRIRTRLDERAVIILTPSGVRRLWQELRDWARSVRRRMNIA